MQERLQKLISRAGVASRRRAELLIVSGQVTVNGAVVTELGSKADAETDHIKVSGKLLHFSQARIYLVLNKPAGCVATMSDPEGRECLGNFLHGVPGRVFPAGRLDFHTEGLLLLTNDGELVNRLLKVSGHLQQVYWIKVKGALGADALQQVQRTVGARLAPLGAREGAANPWYEATVTEAKSDALRQNLSRLGHHVEKIRRVKLADLELGAVEPGKYRMLNEGEVFGLQRAVARAVTRPAAAPMVPAPYQGKEFQKPRRPAGRPMRPGQGERGAARFRGGKPAGPGEYRGRPAGKPHGAPSRPSFGRGPRPGGARPASPPQFPKKRWSRPGGAPTGPTTGRGVSQGSARPGAPRPFSGKSLGKPSGKPSGKPWGRPTGSKPQWKSGGKGERGQQRRSGGLNNHKRTDRE
ncbi:MAG: pseudouridine synthase [Acidobacteria bacterium]|nr:pseudouridine synthase [Acidobacteriota bacterium]